MWWQLGESSVTFYKNLLCLRMRFKLIEPTLFKKNDSPKITKQQLFLAPAFTLVFLLVFQTASKGQLLQPISVSVNHYDQGNHTLDDNVKVTVQPGKINELKFRDTKWVVKTNVFKVPGNSKANDVQIVFLCKDGHIDNTAVSVQMSFKDWSVNNYVLMPAAVYNGNRVESRKVSYPPFINDPRDTGVTKPQLISDVPRLNIHDGPSRIQQRTGDMSTPAIGFYAPSTKKSFWMLTPQATRLGDSGIDIEETADRDEAKISYTAPVVREKYRYSIADTHTKSTDMGATFNAGDSVILSFRIYNDDCNNIQGLFDQFTRIRNDVIPHSSAEPAIRSFSNTFAIQQEKYNRYNFEPKFGYYSVGLRENASQDWQIGWTGGMISTYPLLYDGNDTSVQNVIRNFDWLFPNGIATSGYFWDTGEKGNKWMGIFPDKPIGKDLHLVRKTGDGLYYCLKQFSLMEKKGITVKQPWADGCKRVADALVKTWNTYHQFGQFVNNETGQIVIGGSVSGGILPGALVLASRYYNDATYLNVAKVAAADYYENYVKKGTIYGGPGEAMQNFDSESTAGLLESYTILYEETQDEKWLQAAADVARQLSTWVTSYNYPFPTDSDLGLINAHTTGTVWANTQNKHAAPGICTHSGVSLLKLYRATGDRFYLELLKDIAHAIPQYLSTTETPIRKLKNGWINERVSLTDWLEGIGQVFEGSTWSEVSMMLTSIEIPGLYISLDDNYITTIDHIDAKILKHTKNDLSIQVTNPMKEKISVKILAENKKQKNTALGNLPLWGCETIQLNPGEVKTLNYDK